MSESTHTVNCSTYFTTPAGSMSQFLPLGYHSVWFEEEQK